MSHSIHVHWLYQLYIFFFTGVCYSQLSSQVQKDIIECVDMVGPWFAKKQKPHFSCSYESHVFFSMFSWNLLMLPYCFRMCSWFSTSFFEPTFLCSRFSHIFSLFPCVFPMVLTAWFTNSRWFFPMFPNRARAFPGPPGHAAKVDGWSDRRWRSMGGWSFSRCSPAELRIHSWYRMVNIPKKHMEIIIHHHH